MMIEKNISRGQGQKTAAKIGFGSVVSEHMLVASYHSGAWQTVEIRHFEPLSLHPTALCFHYGQTIFEGMKAFRRLDGRISLFRVERHWERFCASARRMCMPAIPQELFTNGLIELIRTDQDQVPAQEDSSLYIRPFMIASEEGFGVKAAEEYLFIIFTGPVGAYYGEPLRVKIEETFVRAAKGGFGSAKCGGNYGGALYPTQLARQQGFDQVLWTDGSPDLYLEESGTMNLFFLIDGTLVTPLTSDTILDGVTRDSYIQLAKGRGIPVETRKISAFELQRAAHEGKLQEAFGSGTAAVAAPIATITLRGESIHLPAITDQHLSRQLKNELTAIRLGVKDDIYGWNTTV